MTSDPIFRSAAANGRLSPLRPLTSCRRLLPPPAWTLPSFSSVSRKLPELDKLPARTAPIGLPRADDELLELWRDFESRRVVREHRGGYNAGWRCWGCRLFVGGPHATCAHCGYRHGGVNHEAYASR